MSNKSKEFFYEILSLLFVEEIKRHQICMLYGLIFYCSKTQNITFIKLEILNKLEN